MNRMWLHCCGGSEESKPGLSFMITTEPSRATMLSASRISIGQTAVFWCIKLVDAFKMYRVTNFDQNVWTSVLYFYIRWSHTSTSSYLTATGGTVSFWVFCDARPFCRVWNIQTLDTRVVATALDWQQLCRGAGPQLFWSLALTTIINEVSSSCMSWYHSFSLKSLSSRRCTRQTLLIDLL